MRRLAPLFALALALSACTDNGPSDQVLVFAAASLTEVMTELTSEYNSTNPDVSIELSFAGSATIREQVLGGAGADVVMVANEQIMAELVAAGAVISPSIAARNQMVLVMPADNPGNVTSLADLSNESLLVGLCSERVPCGITARLILRNAGVSVSLDTNEPDVRSLLSKVAQGELDAGIVYLTDLRSSPSALTSVTIEQSINETNAYPIAVAVDSQSAEASDSFLSFVLSPAGQRVFAEFGFLGPEEGSQ